MEDYFPTQISLPRLQYKFGEEPTQSAVINQASTFSVVEIVENLLDVNEFQRVNNTFMGPLIKAGKRGLDFSGKIVHCMLTRQLLTKKNNELWFHFGAQPMRFSIREFHMVTGLKCSGEEPLSDTEDQKYKWERLSGGHSLKDLEEELLHTDKESADERFSLAMLMLIEGILLHRYSQYKFPFSNTEKAKDLNVLMNYPWGRDSYMLLLKSVKKTSKSNLRNSKYDLHGFPMAIHLWVLASVPLIQSSFSRVDMVAPFNGYICQRFTKTDMPSLAQIQSIESSENVTSDCL